MTGDDTSSGPDGGIDKLPPGPDGLPVLGNTHQYVKQPMGFFDELAEYGDAVHCTFPRIDAVAVFHPDHVGEVLLGQGTYERWNFDELKQLLNYEIAPRGLTFTRGEEWKTTAPLPPADVRVGPVTRVQFSHGCCHGPTVRVMGRR